MKKKFLFLFMLVLMLPIVVFAKDYQLDGFSFEFDNAWVIATRDNYHNTDIINGLKTSAAELNEEFEDDQLRIIGRRNDYSVIVRKFDEDAEYDIATSDKEVIEEDLSNEAFMLAYAYGNQFEIGHEVIFNKRNVHLASYYYDDSTEKTVVYYTNFNGYHYSVVLTTTKKSLNELKNVGMSVINNFAIFGVSPDEEEDWDIIQAEKNEGFSPVILVLIGVGGVLFLSIVIYMIVSSKKDLKKGSTNNRCNRCGAVCSDNETYCITCGNQLK